MRRTQIQLPDRLYQRLKARATEEESSLADLLRRAGEYYLSLHPVAHSAGTWSPPEPVDLGEFLASESDWRSMAGDDEVSR